MRRVWTVIFMVAVLLIPSVGTAADLTMSLSINSGVFPCDNTVRYYVWWNPEPVTVKLQWSRVWQGMSLGGRADFFVNLYTYRYVGQEPPYKLIHMAGWDHYADPTAPMMSTWDYAPNYVAVPAGQGVLMETGCSATTGGILAHAAAYLGYTK